MNFSIKPSSQTILNHVVYRTDTLQLKKSLPELISVPRIFVTDTTPEGLQNELSENGERSAVITDEGNIFEIMAGLYSDGKSNLDVFLQGHAGGPLRVKRSGRQIYLKKIAVTFGLAVQPQVLADLRTGNKRSFRGKGLLARFLYCIPKSNIGNRDINKRGSVPFDIKAGYNTGIKSLFSIAPSIDEQSSEESPRRLQLDDDALEVWKEFAQWIESEQGEGGRFENQQDFTGKLAGASLRIAGLCHVASLQQQNQVTLSTLSTFSSDIKSEKINRKTMKASITLCKKLIVHAQAAFDKLEDDSAVADAKVSLKWILENSSRDENGAVYFKRSDLHGTNKFKNDKVERVIKALDILRERNIISVVKVTKTKSPSYIYYVNPFMFTATA